MRVRTGLRQKNLEGLRKGEEFMRVACGWSNCDEAVIDDVALLEGLAGGLEQLGVREKELKASLDKVRIVVFVMASVWVCTSLWQVRRYGVKPGQTAVKL
jgi:hypothetical protein